MHVLLLLLQTKVKSTGDSCTKQLPRYALWRTLLLTSAASTGLFKKSPIYPPKSPTFPRNSPKYLQTSPAYSKKSLVLLEKSPARSLYAVHQKNPCRWHQRHLQVFFTKKAFYIRKRAPYIRKRALYIRQRALDIYLYKSRSKGQVCCVKKILANAHAKESWISAKEPACISKKALHIKRRRLSPYISAQKTSASTCFAKCACKAGRDNCKRDNIYPQKSLSVSANDTSRHLWLEQHLHVSRNTQAKEPWISAIEPAYICKRALCIYPQKRRRLWLEWHLQISWNARPQTSGRCNRVAAHATATATKYNSARRNNSQRMAATEPRRCNTSPTVVHEQIMHTTTY